MKLFDVADIHKYFMKQITEITDYPVQMFA